MNLNNYFKNIAVSHTEILHSEENKAFFREYASARIILDTDFHKNLRNCGNNILISQFNDDSQLPVPSNDFGRESPSGTLYILSRIFDNDMDAAKGKAKELRNDIYAKMKYDLQERVLPKSFLISNMSSQTIGRIADNFFGIAIHISFSDKYVAPYTQNKWT